MNSEKINSTKYDTIFEARFQRFLTENKDTNPRDLLLKTSPFSSERTKFAVTQLLGRKIAESKFPTLAKLPYFIYPNSDIMEQASSEITARYKSTIVQGSSLLDVTLGGGFDAYFMAKNAINFVGIERDFDLVQIVNHNFNQLNLTNTSTVYADSMTYLHENQGHQSNWVYADPQRRYSGQKVKGVENYSPKLSEILSRVNFDSTQLLVKLSPMDDHRLLMKTHNNIKQAHYLSIENECKELLVVFGKEESIPTIYTYQHKSVNGIAMEFRSMNEFSRNKSEVEYSNLQQYLYEFNPSIMTSGVGEIEARKLGLSKLAPRTNFYTSDNLLEFFPGRVFKVIESGAYKSEILKDWFPDGRANVSARNFSPGAEELQKKGKLLPSPENIFLIGTSDTNVDRLIIKAELIQ